LLNVPNGDLMLEMESKQTPKLVECPSWNMRREQTYKAAQSSQHSNLAYSKYMYVTLMVLLKVFAPFIFYNLVCIIIYPGFQLLIWNLNYQRTLCWGLTMSL
jgi:hypothetical protein